MKTKTKILLTLLTFAIGFVVGKFMQTVEVDGAHGVVFSRYVEDIKPAKGDNDDG